MKMYFICTFFFSQQLTATGLRGLRGRRVVLIVVIIALELVHLLVLQTADDIVVVEIQSPAIVREDRVSV